MEAPTTGTFSFLGNRHLASGAVVTLVMGGGQLIFDDASSDVIRYLEAWYIALSEAAEKLLVLRQEVQNFMELSMRIPHVHRTAGLSILM